MSIVNILSQGLFSGWNGRSVGAYFGSVVLSQGMGALWYGTFFAHAWTKRAYPELKTQKEWNDYLKDHHQPAKCYGSAFAGSAISFFLLRGVLNVLNVTTAMDGAAVGLFLPLVDAIFGMMHPFFENRPFMLHIINHGYHITCFTMAGAILAVFQ